ncbi:MAG: thiamine diphosphokinase [Clostridiales bacterium]|nr:thiamine diphosphokinase [Clostridiales bacterium]
MENKKTAALISGAPNSCCDFLKNNIDSEKMFVICADSGYTKCIDAGISPDLIIGDFDSAPFPPQSPAPIKLPCVKDDSDTFFCVKKAVELGYKDIEIYNALGNRADHSWANILCLDYCRKAGVRCRIIDEHNRIYTVSESAAIKKDGYDFFSVFAFLGTAEGVSIKNAYYEISSITLRQFDQFGLSNRFIGKDVLISVKKGTLLVVESRD